MNLGKIWLHRKLLEDIIFDNEKGLKVWLWCLLKASWKERIVLLGRNKIKINKGQFIFGREKASEELKMSPSTAYFWMRFLRVNSYINIKTTNKYSIISVKNWQKYQSVNSKVNNKKTTKRQQKDTNNKVNKVNKVNKRREGGKISLPFIKKLKENEKFRWLDIDDELERWKDWKTSKGRVFKNNQAAFRNWLRKSLDFLYEKQPELKGRKKEKPRRDWHAKYHSTHKGGDNL